MKKQNSTSFKFLIFLGIVIIVISFFIGYSRLNFLNNANKTTGIIIGYTETGKTSGLNNRGPILPAYAPIVAFNSSQKENFQFTSSISSNKKSYSVGEKVEVVYQRNNPQIAEIYSFFRIWALTLGVFFLGLIFFLTGFTGLKYPKRVLVKK
jgi:cytochrome c oxidase assembly protein Cox11